MSRSIHLPVTSAQADGVLPSEQVVWSQAVLLGPSLTEHSSYA